MSSFVALYDTPPTGQIPDGQPSTNSTAALSHHLSSDLIPNWVVDYPNAANDLVVWARQYLNNNISHQPGATLQSVWQLIPSAFGETEAANEGSIVDLYSTTVKLASALFVRDADSLPLNAIRFRECPTINHVRSDWAWFRNGETRMIVVHKGKEVFDKFCDKIRNLATATSGAGGGTAIGMDGAGHARDAKAILLKLGRQMIADDCQLGLLFGGQRFILFFMEDHLTNENEVRHVMHCSRILHTVSSSSDPGAIQVTIAALLAGKNDFFISKQLRVGIKAGTRDDEERKTRSAAEKGKTKALSGTEQQASSSRGPLVSADARHAATTSVSRVALSYASARDTVYLFHRVDTDGPGTPEKSSIPSSSSDEDNTTATLIIYDPIGSGASGEVFDADLLLDNQIFEIAAKFFDPYVLIEPGDTSYLSEGDESERLFWAEVEAYRRLSKPSLGLPFYGAFRGKGFTGFETGLVLLEKLADTADNFSDMTATEKQSAYSDILELHKRGIHHGDIEPQNFGWIGSSSSADGSTSEDEETADETRIHKGRPVLYDFSHASFFDQCDPDQCWDLRFAKDSIFGRGE